MSKIKGNHIFFTGIWVLLLSTCSPPQEEPAPKPNIIFVLVDDLGYGDLGCYGQMQIKTPNLDQMAAEGMRFTQHYAGSTVCAPSRCTLMTGLHTGHALVRGNSRVPLGVQDTTVAEVLQQAGYQTALIGKWGLGEAGSTGAPNKKGFDDFLGYLNQIKAHNYYPDSLWRNQERFALDNVVKLAEEGYAKGVGGASTNKVTYSHDLFTEEALNFVEKNAESPFFLYLAYTIPHANNEHWVINEHGLEVPDYGIYAGKDWPEPQKGLAAMISRMDADIGKLLEKLKELGIDENTLVLFTSDNGPHREGENDPMYFNSNGPLRGIKRDLYEGGIRVPLIARWPGKVPSGAVSHHQSAFWDFFPTACEIAEVKTPAQLDGLSYLPALKGETEKQPQHPYLYWEFPSQGGKQALRQGNLKLVHLIEEEQWELYNLAEDVGEQRNIIEEYPAEAAKMKEILSKARTESDYFTLH